MPLKKGDDRVQPGHWRDPLTFYTVDPARGPDGGITNPAGNAVNPILAYTANGNVAPYQGVELRDALREVGETWSTISIPYMPSRIPIEGMRLVIKRTGEEYEIRGVEHVGFENRKVELTCRLVR